MATGPLGATPEEPLRAERDALARRCAAAEEQVRQLTTELEQARAELAARRSRDDDQPLSFFDGEPPTDDRLTGDGSDPRVLSLVLAAIAVVSAMVALLAFANGKLGTPFGVVMVLLTVGLAWGAARTRVRPVEVTVSRGVVYVEQGDDTHRFDLRKGTPIQMVGRPGEPGWAVHIMRRHMDPFVIDASMVDPHEFVRLVREHRPDL